MTRIAILLVALLPYLCGKEKAIVTASPNDEKSQAKPAPAREKKVRGHGYPKLSPFEAVRWRDSIPEVRVKDVWYELLSLNGVSSKEIVAFLKKVEKDQDVRQKRFEEDLVEVLTLMGHDPGKSATLKVRQLDDGKEKELKDVPMTEKNRDAIRDARQRRHP